MSYRHMTKEEIKAKWPNDEDLQYGFDGTDRYGHTYYGKGIRVSVGPSPATGHFFTTGFNNRYPIRGGEHEITNYFALRESGAFVSGDHPPLHSYD